MPSAELEQLLARWRSNFDGALGAEIEALGATLGTRVVLPAAQGEAAALWTTRLIGARADELTPLLVALDELLVRAHGRVGWPCAEALASVPADPRIATFALAYISGAKVPKQMTAKLERRLFDLVERHGDLRAVPVLEAAIGSFPSDVRPRMRNLIAKIEKRIATAPTKPRAETPVDKDDRGEQLLAAIYADPHDDAHRQVYADWLLERSDPRGELINLQLQRAAGVESPRALAREAALIKKHAREWYQAIWSVLDPASVGFEKGFLARCALNEKLRATKAKLLMLRPEWATVESIQLYHPVPLATSMRALRSIHGLQNTEIGLLDELGLAQLDALGVVMVDGQLRRVVEALARRAVTHLTISDTFYRMAPFALLDELRALPHGDALRSFAIVGASDLWARHEWKWESLQDSRLEQFSYSLRSYSQDRVVLHRERGAWSRVVVHVHDPRYPIYDRVEELVWDGGWGPALAHFRGRDLRELVIVTSMAHPEATSLWRLCASLGPVRHAQPA